MRDAHEWGTQDGYWGARANHLPFDIRSFSTFTAKKFLTRRGPVYYIPPRRQTLPGCLAAIGAETLSHNDSNFFFTLMRLEESMRRVL